jgi:hypothetical protein
MKISTSIHSVIAIDQWNAVRDCRDNSLFKRLFGSFDRLKVYKGGCYLAVSSSFSFPGDLFADVDLITHRVTVNLYNADELHIIAQSARGCSYLPPAENGLDDNKLTQLCGRVGRMIAFARYGY